MPIKRIDVKEFRALGFVQEVNRRLLHPCGLALEVVVEEDGTERLGGVWDYRDDTEGMAYGDPPDDDKAASVRAAITGKLAGRIGRLGFVVQPPGVGCDDPDESGTRRVKLTETQARAITRITPVRDEVGRLLLRGVIAEAMGLAPGDLAGIDLAGWVVTESMYPDGSHAYEFGPPR